MRHRVLLCLLVTGVTARAADAQVRAFPEPTGFWDFDNCTSTTAWDRAVAPHHAALSGVSCPLGGGRYGTAAHFNGNARAEIAGSGSLHPATFTIAAWVRPTSNTRGTIANKWYAMDSWGLWYGGGQYSFAVAFPNGSWGASVTAAAAGPIDTWTHVAGVFDGSRLTLYLNGQQVAQQNGLGPTAQSSTRPIVIGSHPTWDGFRGAIDEVKFYSTALPVDDIRLLATPPSSLGNRGLHLFPDQYACAVDEGTTGYCRGSSDGLSKFRRDLNIIHSIANLNSIKTVVTTMRTDPNPGPWMAQQLRKLSYLASATGGSKTWVVRAAPSTLDCTVPVTDYYACGHQFAQSLQPVFTHLATLHLPYVYIEVANEPNIADPHQIPFYDPAITPTQNMVRYNDFFRGFYFGQQALGFGYQLVYAGLSPDCQSGYCRSLDWYRDYWVRYHIDHFAEKVGVHVYWTSTNAIAPGGRLDRHAGAIYRDIYDILVNPTQGGYTLPPHGLQFTEFNLNKASARVDHAAQATEVCEWSRQVGADASAGMWTEQTMQYITSNIPNPPLPNEAAAYWFDDSQVSTIRNCQ